MTSANLPRLPFTRQEEIERYRFLREESDDPDRKWILLIKELRATHGCSIFEAERIALSDDRLRRWVQLSINTRRKCRKQALAHIKYNDENSLIHREDETFKFRIPRP